MLVEKMHCKEKCSPARECSHVEDSAGGTGSSARGEASGGTGGAIAFGKSHPRGFEENPLARRGKDGRREHKRLEIRQVLNRLRKKACFGLNSEETALGAEAPSFILRNLWHDSSRAPSHIYVSSEFFRSL